MLIRFTCPAGHRIKADARFGGRLMACPACRRPTPVPTPTPAGITESAAVRLLNDCDSDAPESEQHWHPVIRKPAKPTKPCPRCKAAVPANAEFCSSCRVRLFPSTRIWKNVCRAAAERVFAH